MRFLCISDIHGHVDALRAVLASAERIGYGQLLVAGDHCFPGPAPLATFQLLQRANATCARGASDLALGKLDLARVAPASTHEAERLGILRRVRDELGELIVERLVRLPEMVRVPLEDGGELVLVHGSPADPLEPFTHDMSDDELRALVGDDPADIIVCGGSHVPFDRTVLGVRILGVGSVGEALAGDPDAPRHADATWLEVRADGTVVVEPFAVPLSEKTALSSHAEA